MSSVYQAKSVAAMVAEIHAKVVRIERGKAERIKVESLGTRLVRKKVGVVRE